MKGLRIIAVSFCGLLTAAAAPDDDGNGFFETRIRPLLADKCYSCHGAEKHKADLRLDSADGMKTGGESGVLFTAGDPAGSLLIRAVGYKEKDLQMPPKERLTERQVADLSQWIQMGAPMPKTAPGGVAVRKEFAIKPEDRAHWAFQPLKPEKAGGNPVDFFILAALETKGLAMNPSATRRELIRRAAFDLTGLPPTPEEVAAFERDADPLSYEKLIDRLLSLPQYGERWGRHWLDVARFAQSNGYERDGEKALAWKYRDYVIKAFNDDKPYDRFVMEQLAGDELPDATAESITATAFQRLGVFDDEPADKKMAEFDALDDILSTTGAAFMGLTVGCARCHDHKFDPISQEDYYSLLACFRGVRPFDNEKVSEKSAGYVTLPPAPNADPAAPKEMALAVREGGKVPPATHILIRGSAATAGTEVKPEVPVIFRKEPLRIPDVGSASSGRRLALARWIASPENPLTARVLVNRVWKYIFGKGIVRTTADFGRVGSPPTNPKLLDALAAAFIDSGWSLKKLHRLIMLSQTYRQSSRADTAKALATDPGNDLMWRQNFRRLEAEALRDAVLRTAGTLNPAMGGRGFFPHFGGEVLGGQSRPGHGWDVSTPDEQSRRSLYAFVRRTMGIPLLETLDYNNTTSPLTERATTTVAPQALMLLNDGFLHDQSRAFAARLVKEVGVQTGDQIRRAWQLALHREPSPEEINTAGAWLSRQTQAFAAISSRSVFRPDVSQALQEEYFTKLQPADMLLGPRKDWVYGRGVWGPGYEQIRTLDRELGPFGLWQGGHFRDGVIDATLSMQRTAERAGILFRASNVADAARGYEVVLDPRRQKLLLRRHAEKSSTLAETSTVIPADEPFALRIEARGADVSITLQGKALLSVKDPEPLPGEGKVGARIWGGSLQMDALTFDASTGERVTVPGDNPSPATSALQSLCLMLFNLNEFVYID